ncbi:MAG: lytic murein transglycosylase [Thermodesulfobacteriota bacterium]
MSLKQIRWTLLILLIALVSPAGIPAADQTDYFGSLQKRLIQDRFSAQRISALYQHPSVAFETRGVSLYFIHQESKLNYDQFLEPGPIQRAKTYMVDHQPALIQAEQAFGVHRYVITAILLVETRLGTYVGNRLVLNTFSSMAALADPAVRRAVWNEVAGTTHLTKARFNAKADQKARWAYDELKAFLTFTQAENIDPHTVVGSYAGAMGYCQFLPSNALKLARDGNGDGRIDLFNHADAIMSVASYLNRHGWRSGISQEKAYKSVYHYNHSKYYVNTVLRIVDVLKG